ncbi:MAG: hypothetical protein P8Q14_06035 [Vicingaceae bacterium]|nr:hypothetical protein [Vicingaceae bacterium]
MLIDISGQQFYSTTIDQLAEECSQKERCALIIDEKELTEFTSKSKTVVGKSVNQIIVISESLNAIHTLFEGEKVLLISVLNYEEAVKIAVSGVELSQQVICIADKEGSELKRVFEELSVES